METFNLNRNDRRLIEQLTRNIGALAEALDQGTDDGCPNCGRPPVGATAVTLRTRGSDRKVEAAICPECGTVYVTNDE